MIEIQCTSCHTRYRIDEHVLPADSPTFKCSRCGHVFTADPVAAKKLTSEPSSKPQAARASNPRANSKPDTNADTTKPKTPAEASTASERQSAAASPLPEPESKPAPIKPYIRSQRPTVFDRTPEPPAAKQSEEPISESDGNAVAQMKAAVETQASASVDEPRHARQSPHTAKTNTAAQSRNESDAEGENLEFDFSDERELEFGPEPSEDDVPAAESWSVGDDAPEQSIARPPGFGSDEPDPGFSRGEPAPIGRGTIPRYAGSPPPQHSPLPDEQAFIERAEFHTARSFIGVFFVVALMFVALTFVIYGTPSASTELLRRMPVIGPEFVQSVALENLLVISDVRSSYQTVKGGHAALVVTGVVGNHSTAALHMVQIGVRLLDAAQHDVASSAVYVGTTLSPRMIGEMTPHELEFLQKLDPQKTFVLQPGHGAPFLMVFIDPPHQVGHLRVGVSRVQPPATAPTTEASAHL